MPHRQISHVFTTAVCTHVPPKREENIEKNRIIDLPSILCLNTCNSDLEFCVYIQLHHKACIYGNIR